MAKQTEILDAKKQIASAGLIPIDLFTQDDLLKYSETLKKIDGLVKTSPLVNGRSSNEIKWLIFQAQNDRSLLTAESDKLPALVDAAVMSGLGVIQKHGLKFEDNGLEDDPFAEYEKDNPLLQEA